MCLACSRSSLSEEYSDYVASAKARFATVWITLVLMAAVMPSAPPSPLPDGESSLPKEKKQQVYYRPSLDLTLRLLRLKIQYFASESHFGMFDHLVRSLGRDGLLEPSAEIEVVNRERTF